MHFAAIADDITGGTDLASVLRRHGLDVVQLVDVPEFQLPPADAVVISLKTRTIASADAVAHSRRAARALADAGAEQVYFKYCSTFDSTDRGNIGPVLEALIDATATDVAVACPAYPTLGRTVYNGHLFVGADLLSDSSMRHHPLTPMADANLLRVLGRQTRMKLGLVTLATVEDGAPSVRAAFDRLAGSGCRIAVADAVFDRHIDTLAAASARLKVASGGAALGGALGKARTEITGRRHAFDAAEPASVGPIAILSGSCSAATQAQVRHLGTSLPCFTIDPVAFADDPAAGDRLVTWSREHARRCADVLIVSTAATESLDAIQTALGRVTAAHLVETAFQRAARSLADAGVRTFIVAGGETSGAVVHALGVRALRFGREIEPGVPWARSLGPDGYRLALKSGNFGGPDFFAKALEEARERT